MDATTFRNVFPQFINIDNEQVDAFLALAATRIHAASFGDAYDAAHGYLTAHMISVSPMLNTAKLDKKDGTEMTTYLKEFRKIRLERGLTPIST